MKTKQGHSATYYSTVRNVTNTIRERFSANENMFLNRILTESIKMETAIDAIGKVYTNRNPTITDAAHFKKVTDNAKRLGHEVERSSDRIALAQSDAATDIERRITERLNLKENQYGSELRAALRSMTETERHKTMIGIIKAADGPAIAAITNTPSYLTGITDELKSRYMNDFQTVHATDLIEERDSLLETISNMATVMSTANKAAKSYLDPERLAQIEADESAASEADTAFNESVAS